jgi:hypothetical protein
MVQLLEKNFSRSDKNAGQKIEIYKKNDFFLFTSAQECGTINPDIM